MLKDEWEVNLNPCGVKLPKEDSWKREVLEFLYENINEWVSKESIIEGIGYNGTDLQAPRHLASDGWYIKQDYKVSYKLVSVTKILPNWIPKKRTTNIPVADWESLKTYFKNKCASCGSDEGQPHIHTGQIVKLEKGHKDPDLDLTLENTIPQCNYCNKRHKDIFKFDNYGIPIMVKIEGVWVDIPNYNRTK